MFILRYRDTPYGVGPFEDYAKAIKFASIDHKELPNAIFEVNENGDIRNIDSIRSYTVLMSKKSREFIYLKTGESFARIFKNYTDPSKNPKAARG